MEIESEDGSKIPLKAGSKTVFGRGVGFPFQDATVSRRHILFELEKDDNQDTPDSETKVHFQVLGKNPVWVFSNNNKGDAKVFRKSDKGEMRAGDSFCVSAKNSTLFKLKRCEMEEKKGVKEENEGDERVSVEEEMEEIIESGFEGSELGEELGFGSVDISDIDPVQEFGFLVKGHEFDRYPKTKIRAIKDWEWFLEERRVDSDTDDASEKKRSKGKKGGKRKKGDEGYDEEWTGESEDEKEVISKVRKGKRPKYTTRSKDVNKKTPGGAGTSKKAEEKKVVSQDEDEEDDDDEDEEDETLGGFIVDEEVEEEDNDEDDEEEEEFEDEDEDD